MKLEEVLPALRDGKKIRRASMPATAYEIKEDRINVCMLDRCEIGECWGVNVVEVWGSRYSNVYFCDADVLAKDWEVVE